MSISNFPHEQWRRLTTAGLQAFVVNPRSHVFDRQSKIGNQKLIDSLASRLLALSGLPVHFAASPAAQFTHLPSSEVRIGSSSIMNWVLPIAPIMRVPVAAYHFFDISSPVWQPQLFT